MKKWFLGKNVLINVLQYNETDYAGIKRPNKQQLVQFKRELEKEGLVVKLRESRGNNIKAACGQLVSKHNRNKKDDDNTRKNKPFGNKNKPNRRKTKKRG